MTDDVNADNLLDVFKSVEVEGNIASVLSRELGDVSIHSLLEQTRQVADGIKRGRLGVFAIVQLSALSIQFLSTKKAGKIPLSPLFQRGIQVDSLNAYE